MHLMKPFRPYAICTAICTAIRSAVLQQLARGTGLVLLSTHLAMANPLSEPSVNTVRLGQGEFRYFGFQVYQAALDAKQRIDALQWDQHALTLTLTYRRALKGAAIAERSLEEMRRSKDIDAVHEVAWLNAMRRCFPDVQEGDRLQGFYQPAAGIRFDHNGKSVCTLKDADFAKQFMGIWLHETSSAPDLRAQLLGLRRAEGS